MSATDTLGADIIVATPVVRSQFGTRLASVYAPEVIASFGSGPSQIEVRYAPPDGAQSYYVTLTADRGARVAAGWELVHNQHVHASGPARGALIAGRVDPRLLVVLAALAAQQQVSVTAFGDVSPGAADVPLRGAMIGAGPLALMQATRSFLLSQRPPYLPAQTRLIQESNGQYLLVLQFDAPSPLGLSGGL